MLERIKASFTRRDAQHEKLLPGYGLLYFDNLYGEYRSLPAERVIPEVKAIVDEIRTENRTPPRPGMIFIPLTYFSPGFNLLKSCLEKFGICGPDTVTLLVYGSTKPIWHQSRPTWQEEQKNWTCGRISNTCFASCTCDTLSGHFVRRRVIGFPSGSPI